MIDDQLKRWLARLPLSEQVAYARQDQQQDDYASPKDPRTTKAPRCVCCGVHLKPTDDHDAMRRCRTCRRRNRNPVGTT